MASVPLHYVDLRTFRYATEDERRVEDALRTFLPEETEITRTPSEGHFGDPIDVLSVRLERADDVTAVIAAVESLPEAAFDRLLTELDERVDEDCSIHVTFDKQAAATGEVALGEGITLRAKVEAYPAKRVAAVENLRAFLEGS